MKKSRSSVPRFVDRCELAPPPPVRYEGLFATAGRPVELPAAPAAPLVAIAVGKTNEGESLPANPVPIVSLLTPGYTADAIAHTEFGKAGTARREEKSAVYVS